jgi:Protein of unknown function (DUF4236)
MGFRFYRRVRIAPGFTLNLSKRGASISAGVRGAHVTIGTHGTRETVGLPGTGISYTATQGRHRRRPAAMPPQPAAPLLSSWWRHAIWVLVAAALIGWIIGVHV